MSELVALVVQGLAEEALKDLRGRPSIAQMTAIDWLLDIRKAAMMAMPADSGDLR